MSQFYQLRLDEAIALYQSKDITAKGLLRFFFRIRLASGWSLNINAERICSMLGMARSTFWTALSALRSDGEIKCDRTSDMKITRIGQSTQKDSNPESKTVVQDSRQPVPETRQSVPETGQGDKTVNEKISKPAPSKKSERGADSSPDLVQSSSNSLSNQQAKQRSKSSKEAYREFWANLPTSEREKFLAFVDEKTKHFSNPIVCKHDYLASDRRWSEFYLNFRAVAQVEDSNTRDWTKHPCWSKALKSMEKNSGMFLAFGSMGCEHLPREVRRAMREYAKQQKLI